MDSIIQVKDISYRYEESGQEAQLVLNGISLEIERGSFVTIVGHNGSGKSTFAKHLNALFVPTQGVVLVDGFDTADEEHVFEVRKTAGMVFQNPDNQMVATVVEEDVAFGLENLGVPSEEIKVRVAEALEAVDMSRFAKNSPHHLSGGQKQRVSIAGVLAMKPKIIIFDEVTAMLDPKGRQEIMQIASHFHRELGITIINITHNMEEAILSQRVIVLNDGKIAADETPRELFARQEFLKDLGLNVPLTVQLASSLHQMGVDIPPNLLTEEEIVEALCQLK